MDNLNQATLWFAQASFKLVLNELNIIGHFGCALCSGTTFSMQTGTRWFGFRLSGHNGRCRCAGRQPMFW